MSNDALRGPWSNKRELLAYKNQNGQGGTLTPLLSILSHRGIRNPPGLSGHGGVIGMSDDDDCTCLPPSPGDVHLETCPLYDDMLDWADAYKKNKKYKGRYAGGWNPEDRQDFRELQIKASFLDLLIAHNEIEVALRDRIKYKERKRKRQ